MHFYLIINCLWLKKNFNVYYFAFQLIKHINVPNANACVNIPISSSGSDTVACKSPAKSPIVRSSISTRLQERLSNKRKTTYDEHSDKTTAATRDDKAEPSISVVAENKKSNDPKKVNICLLIIFPSYAKAVLTCKLQYK